jgi:hypothetical protein
MFGGENTKPLVEKNHFGVWYTTQRDFGGSSSLTVTIGGEDVGHASQDHTDR